MENLSLRTAEPDDEFFLKRLFFDVRRDEFAPARLPSAQLEALLAMQYEAQRQAYGWSFPHSEQLIIELKGEKIGRLLITRSAGKIHLHDISIVREFRGRGVGAFLLEQLKTETEVVRLRVFKTNDGAQRLYERLGFEPLGDDGEYIEMEWKNA